MGLPNRFSLHEDLPTRRRRQGSRPFGIKRRWHQAVPLCPRGHGRAAWPGVLSIYSARRKAPALDWGAVWAGALLKKAVQEKSVGREGWLASGLAKPESREGWASFR
jgi:hypothetical protein